MPVGTKRFSWPVPTEEMPEWQKVGEPDGDGVQRYSWPEKDLEAGIDPHGNVYVMGDKNTAAAVEMGVEIAQIADRYSRE